MASASAPLSFADIQESIKSLLRQNGMSITQARSEAATRTKDIMNKLAALHEPDMVADGWMSPDGLYIGNDTYLTVLSAQGNQCAASVDADLNDQLNIGKSIRGSFSQF